MPLLGHTTRTVAFNVATGNKGSSAPCNLRGTCRRRACPVRTRTAAPAPCRAQVLSSRRCRRGNRRARPRAPSNDRTTTTTGTRATTWAQVSPRAGPRRKRDPRGPVLIRCLGASRARPSRGGSGAGAGAASARVSGEPEAGPRSRRAFLGLGAEPDISVSVAGFGPRAKHSGYLDGRAAFAALSQRDGVGAALVSERLPSRTLRGVEHRALGALASLLPKLCVVDADASHQLQQLCRAGAPGARSRHESPRQAGPVRPNLLPSPKPLPTANLC